MDDLGGPLMLGNRKYLSIYLSTNYNNRYISQPIYLYIYIYRSYINPSYWSYKPTNLANYGASPDILSLNHSPHVMSMTWLNEQILWFNGSIVSSKENQKMLPPYKTLPGKTTKYMARYIYIYLYIYISIYLYIFI